MTVPIVVQDDGGDCDNNDLPDVARAELEAATTAAVSAVVVDGSLTKRHWNRARVCIRALVRFQLLSRWHDASDDDSREEVAGGGHGRLDQYEKIDVMGIGGAAIVYLVRDRDTGVLYAMKVQACSDPGRDGYVSRHCALLLPSCAVVAHVSYRPGLVQTHRAHTERRILELLGHPFICGLHDAFVDSGRMFLVLEFCSEGTLVDAMTAAGGRLSERAVRAIAAEVIQALEYVHLSGFIYRDLKPQNVLLAEDGHIRLCDFGVAESGLPIKPDQFSAPMTASTCDAPGPGALDYASDVSTCPESSGDEDHFVNALPIARPRWSPAKRPTAHERESLRDSNVAQIVLGVDDRVKLRSNSFVGTIDYMPPEMIKQVDFQTTDVDWWALGCLLYELIYGRPPFRSEGGTTKTSSLFRRILGCDVEFPMFPLVSDTCKDFLRGLLQKTSAARIGHHHGAAEVKAHAFFRGVQWALLQRQPLPIRFRRRSPRQLSCADGDVLSIQDELSKGGNQSDRRRWRRWAAEDSSPTSLCSVSPRTEMKGLLRSFSTNSLKPQESELLIRRYSLLEHSNQEKLDNQPINSSSNWLDVLALKAKDFLS